MVLKGINSIGLQVIGFDLVWSTVICFNLLWSTLKTYNVWSWKKLNSVGLQVIRFDLVWSALKSYNVWSWKESIQLVFKWSTLICFKILCMVLKEVKFSCSISDLVWSGLICFGASIPLSHYSGGNMEYFLISVFPKGKIVWQWPY